MSHEHNPAPDAEPTGDHEQIPAITYVEAAWLAWSMNIQNIDQQVMALLRDAFKAGFEAAEKVQSENSAPNAPTPFF